MAEENEGLKMRFQSRIKISSWNTGTLHLFDGIPM
jgi:hypothetical protein